MKAGEPRAIPEPQAGIGREKNEGVERGKVSEGEVHCLGGCGREVGVSRRTESMPSKVKCSSRSGNGALKSVFDLALG